MSRAIVFSCARMFLCALGLMGCGARSGLAYSDDPEDAVDGRVPAFGSGGTGTGGGSTGSAGSSGVGVSGAAGSDALPAPDIDRPPPPLQPNCDRRGEHEGDVDVFRPEDLDQLEGCTALRGALRLSGSLDDVHQLRSLQTITGQLSILRGPRSLQGLERLTSVQDIQLEFIRASSLAPLSGLTEARTLSIGGDVPQGNLSGLSGIRNLQVLTLQNSSLGSLSGLAVPAQMQSIRIVSSSVNDLGVLAGVSAIDGSLEITATSGLSTLDVFRNLTSVRSLTLSQNPDLIHIDGLSQITGLDQLVLLDNPRLEHLPDLDGLRSLEVLDIERNAALRSAPRFRQATRIAQTTVRQNPMLERIVFSALTATTSSTSPNSGDVNQIVIAENQVLNAVLMPVLTRVTLLTIAANPSLSSVDFGALTFVPDRLTVVANPLLPSASLSHLRDVQTSQLKLGANQGDVPLTSCPWLADDRCDEVSLLCSAGSDSQDCSSGYPPY